MFARIFFDECILGSTIVVQNKIKKIRSKNVRIMRMNFQAARGSSQFRA